MFRSAEKTSSGLEFSHTGDAIGTTVRCKRAGRTGENRRQRDHVRTARHPFVEGVARGKQAQSPTGSARRHVGHAGVVGDDVRRRIDRVDEPLPAQISASVPYVLRRETANQIVNGLTRARGYRQSSPEGQCQSQNDLDKLTIVARRPLPHALVGEGGYDDRRRLGNPHHSTSVV